jgi:hypothetical protein
MKLNIGKFKRSLFPLKKCYYYNIFLLFIYRKRPYRPLVSSGDYFIEVFNAFLKKKTLRNDGYGEF